MTLLNNQPHLHDATEREKALDPHASFIVQAPAGSGKTELLTQRYLLLLAHVKQPEEILAITFTKKSAAEMRARIIKALKNAHQHPEPTSPHEKQTWRLAKNALAQNQLFTWNLLDNPNRLQIQTIDSFNASLTRQLPLLSNFGAPLDIADDAYPMYRLAVQEFLSHLEENFSWVNAIETLLIHMDNDLANVETLLINMLAKRDQWIPYISSNTQHPELRRLLEKHLANIITDNLIHLHEQFPLDITADLISLIQFSTQNLAAEDPESPILACIDLTDLPKKILSDRNRWLGIAKFLLTEQGQWRKTVNKKQGFPSPSDAKNSAIKLRLNEAKQKMKDLLDALSEREALRQALVAFTLLPSERYQDSHWETLHALHQILHVVVAQLKLIFQEQGKIDYIENAQAALVALGSEEEPTDITLALDYKIQHILIDEFQDTSNTQYRLLEKLISGWLPDDGRTLFVVGDPMQSIYRFREAEVGLFIRSRKKGISNLHLQPLTLSVNFRSISDIVDWVNEHFQKVMPATEDIGSGAVSYSPSMARQETKEPEPAVKLHPFTDADEHAQATAIADLIQHTRQHHPQEKIAILVRSRTHLRAILPALKKSALTFRSLDIEPLATRPVIQDLLALTQALLHPADRIAWLAILRAPWCGLTLSDLLIIAGDKTKSILWEQLQRPAVTEQLAPDYQARVKQFVRVIDLSFSARRRYSLREWIEQTWLQLGGPACVDQHSDLEDAQAFFRLLEKLDHAGDLSDFKQLKDSISKLYAAPNNQANDSLQIMTIHNAKGLEFDHVILPHLERKASQDEKQLLQWMERARSNDRSDLILAPIQAVGEDKNAIYEYIKRQHNTRTDHENGRLLYVAATRAKKQLHLFFNLKSKENQPTEIKDPANNSLLQKLWPAIRATINDHLRPPQSSANTVTNTLAHHIIKRLAPTWKNILPNPLEDEFGFHQKQTGFILKENTAQHMGTLIHHILQTVSQLGQDWWTSNPHQQKNYLEKKLLQMGILRAETTDIITTIQQAIHNTLSDTRGQWIISSHQEAHSEFPLTTATKNLIIDRTFIDEKGTRWIIDYKSTTYSGETLENFLDFEQKQHESQLREYHHALKNLSAHPIRVGLYFPLIPAWKEWSFE